MYTHFIWICILILLECVSQSHLNVDPYVILDCHHHFICICIITFFGCVSQSYLVVHPHLIWISIFNLSACASLSHLDMYTHFISLFGVHPHLTSVCISLIWICNPILFRYVFFLFRYSSSACLNIHACFIKQAHPKKMKMGSNIS